MRWRELPNHTRRGLLRLYLVLTGPWLVWHCIAIYSTIYGHSYWRWRDISNSCWSLLIVPVGGPLLVQAFLWVRSGFDHKSEKRKSHDVTPNGLFKSGKVLAEIFMKPDVWRDIEKLHGWRIPKAVVGHEIAFARVALIRDTVRTWHPDTAANEILAGIDEYIVQACPAGENPETLEYYGQRLSAIAPEIIRLYEKNVVPLSRLASVLARRLSITSMSETEIAALFTEVASEAEQLMKVQDSLTKLGMSLNA